MEVFKLKGLSEQVRNDYIRGAKEKLEARLAKEATEKAEREVAEKAVAKAAAKEVAKKVAAEAEAREKDEAEAALAIEVAQNVVEDVENTTEVALTRGES